MPPVPAAHLEVTNPIGEPPLRRFLGRLPLVLDTGAAGDRPRIDPTTSRFHAVFQHHEYDALGSGPLSAAVSSTTVNDKRRVIVTLDAPRRLRRLSSSANAGTKLALYRVDGSTFGVEPTVKTGSRTSGHTYAMNKTFVDGRFGVEGGTALALDEILVRSEPAGVALAIVPASLSDAEAAAAVPAWRSSDPAPTSVDLGEEFAAAVQGVVDDLSASLPSPLQLSVVVTADAPLELDIWQMTAPHVLVDEGFAPLPLVSSDVSDPDALVTALRVPRDAVTAFLRSLLDDATRQQLDRAEVNAAALVERILVALSDALVTTALWDPVWFADVAVPPDLVAAASSDPTGERRVRINRRLLEVALPTIVRARTERRVLDLGDRPTVVVRRPPGGPVVSATLVAVPDPDAGVSVEDAAPDDGLAAIDPAGAEVSTTAWVAAAIDPQAAVSVDAVEVLLLGARSPTAILLEVREDHGGLPAGRALATGTAVVPAGRADWVRVGLGDRVLLGTADHWVALRCADGRALWMARPDGQARWARREGEHGWVDWVHDGSAARVRLVTDVSLPGASPSLVVPVDGVDLPPGDLSDPTVRDLAGAFGVGTTEVAESVALAPRGSGTIQVEPPVVVYEPG